MNDITPLNHRILTTPVEEIKMSGDIFLPDSAVEKPKESLVVEVGPDVEHVKVGDRVLASQYGGLEISYGGTAYRIYEEVDILAVVTDD